MIIIVDTNIIISACLDSNSDLYHLITSSFNKIDFVTPEFSLKEIITHQENICKKSRKNIAIFKTNLLATLNCITVLSDDELTESDIENAENFTRQIDIDDTIFIAFALALNSLLWTGDRKLLNGVKRNGFTNIISTKELKDIIKGL